MLNEFSSLSPFLTTLLQITDLQSERWWVGVCVWLGGLDDTTQSSDIAAPERRQRRNSFWGHRPFSKGWKCTLCYLTSKSHLILDTFVPFPPLASLILTHHLNKEVRAMIKSSHSANQVARQMSDLTLSETHFCVKQPPVLSVSVTLSSQLSVDIACQWRS